MSKEGSTGAPIRHPINFSHPDFINPKKLDDEMRRVFDICHGCRRCFNLCDSFPKLFDFIDETKDGEVTSLPSEKFKPVVDACTLCDMCFMTKCPYVPPHEFNLDFPHLMLRYRMAQKKNDKITKTTRELAKIDRNAKIGIMFNSIINWISDVKNKLFRKILEIFTGIDKRAILPKYNNETFSKYFKKFKKNISVKNSNRKVVVYSTCFVNFNRKNTGEAAVKVLTHNNVEVEHSYAGCCGMPHLEQADPEKVVKQAKIVSKELLKYVDKGYKVVTLTASCGLMLKFEWPLLMPLDENIKKTTDLSIIPNDLMKPEYKIIKDYINKLYECHMDYIEMWPFLKANMQELDLGAFLIQKYNPGDHFQRIHSERTTISNSHRVLAWMTYLNNVDDGGNTFFENYDLKIKPEQGKTLIWPAEWTHAHSGEILESGVKYIITGWMNFPYTRQV